jgi:ActR/RegA family two-component response regulator
VREVRGLPLRVELVGASLAEIVPVAAGIERRQIAPEELEAAAATEWADVRVVDLDEGSGVIAALARAADPERTIVTVAVSRNPAHAPVALAAGAGDFALLPRDRGWLAAAILRERDRRATVAEPERLIVEIPSKGLSFEEFERRVVEHALERAGWNRSRAARELGISRPRLQRKIERYGLVPLAGA